MSDSEQLPDGLLLVDKPGALPSGAVSDEQDYSHLSERERAPSPTSHDIVQMVRRWSRQRRIGHTGTLDPMASGLLVLCLGKATRLVEYYQGHAKTYLAQIRLGTATDTYDGQGKVVKELPIPKLDRTQLESALDQFRGAIMQTPPIYSALKQQGESLHRKARRGEKVTIKPRPITIHELILVDWNGIDRIDLRIRCSAGTYIRSLAHDLGIALGTAAHLGALRREGAGAFRLTDAYDLNKIAAAAADGRLSDLLLAPGTGLDLPAMTLDSEQVRLLGYGQQISIADSTTAEADLNRAYDNNGNFVGIIRCLTGQKSDAGRARWKAEKWFGQQ